jgi:caffeoyl-CoA O-methyltransferase
MTMNDDLRSQLHAYVSERFVREDEVLKSVCQETAQQGLPLINIDPYEGRMLQLFVMMSGAKKVIEIGTLAGYSGIWIARGLPSDGKLITIDKSSKHADLARSHFEQAGLTDKVTVYQGNALQILRKISSDAPYDIVFIDADKPNYSNYLEWAVDNLRTGGTIMAHNAFWGGRILSPDTPDAHAVVEFNEKLATHPRLESTIVEVGDGLAIGVKI